MTAVRGPATARLAFLVTLVALCAAFPSDLAWQTIPRLLLATGAVLIVPGWLLVRALSLFPQADVPFERGVLAFGLGYVLVTVVCIAITLVEVNVWWGVLLLGALAAVLATRGSRPAGPAAGRSVPLASLWSLEGAVVTSLAIVLFAFAWLVEPRMGGEETFELIVLRKILENAAVSLDNTLHRPDAVFPYVFAPHYFAMALLAKVAGLSLFVVYVKLRAVYALIALAAFWAVVRRLTGSRSAGLFAVVALMLLVLIDPDPWFWPASLFPLVRRGGFAMGVLFPIFALTTLLAAGGRRRWPELVWPPLILLAMLFTHAMSATFALFLLVGLAAMTYTAASWREYRRAYTVLVGSALALFLVYAGLSQLLVSHLPEYLARDRAELRSLVTTLVRDPIRGVVGGVPEGGQYLIAVSGAVTVYSMFPILWLPLVLWRSPALGRWLWGPIVLPLVLYTTPLGLATLQLATVKEAVFAGGYFSPVGLMLFAIALFTLVQPLDRWLGRMAEGEHHLRWFARVVVLCVVAILVSRFILLPLCWWCMDQIVKWPSLPLLVGGAGGLAVMMSRRVRSVESPVEYRDLVHQGALLTVWVCLLLPVLVGLKSFPGAIAGSKRASAYAQYRDTRSVPPVTDWEAYYPVFQEWNNPTVDMPWRVVRALERVIPRERVVVYDPRHSMTIPLLLNNYIVNPGTVFSTDMEYFRDYVRKDAGESEVHPIFNQSPVLDEKEREFLRQYNVEYVIANPAYHDLVAHKMGQLPGAELLYDWDGFSVHRLAAAVKR